MDELEKAKEVLKSNGYIVNSLWHIDDVKVNFECTDAEAYQIVSGCASDDYHMQSINESIEEACEDKGLIRINDL